MFTPSEDLEVANTVNPVPVDEVETCDLFQIVIHMLRSVLIAQRPDGGLDKSRFVLTSAVIICVCPKPDEGSLRFKRELVDRHRREELRLDRSDASHIRDEHLFDCYRADRAFEDSLVR